MTTAKPVPSTGKRRTSTKKAETALIADHVVSQTEMAAILGISTRMLRVYTADGILEREKAGYRIGQTVRIYADHLKNGSEKKSGGSSMDALREEKALDLRLNRARKDRELISLDEALFVQDEITGLFLSYLVGLPAEITGEPRERRRLNEIIDKGRLRLADRLAKKISALRTGQETSDAEAED